MTKLTQETEDVVERLRHMADNHHAIKDSAAMTKAADLLEGLSDRIDVLRKALLEAALALETPARCVFNDNGDHTITDTVLAPEVYSACYYASRTVKDALASLRTSGGE